MSYPLNTPNQCPQLFLSSSRIFKKVFFSQPLREEGYTPFFTIFLSVLNPNPKGDLLQPAQLYARFSASVIITGLA